jgi:hypothetical protein
MGEDSFDRLLTCDALFLIIIPVFQGEKKHISSLLFDKLMEARN